MPESMMQKLWDTAYLSADNADYVDELYERYLHDPNEVPEEWRNYFQTLPVNGNVPADVAHSAIRDYFIARAKTQQRSQPIASTSISSDHERKQVKVLRLIQVYRLQGHQLANLDPLELWKRSTPEALELQNNSLTEADLDTVFACGDLFPDKKEAPLKEILSVLKDTYCRNIGMECMHIIDTTERRWILRRFEHVRGRQQYSPEVKKHLLERLTAADGLERYLGNKYPGAKRFSLEGGDALIPMIDELIQRAGTYGVKEVVMSMAHRGRLNVLVNTLGKNPRDLFDEFEGKKKATVGVGDVKYHQGFSSNVMSQGGEIHLALGFNPSHLEIGSPVMAGSVRARQDRRVDTAGEAVLPITIHGDAAFAGQGVVMETFQMSQTRAYKTGGTVHIVINNQVGFTTSRPDDARSTEYSTEVAKMVQAPIFHVNGDDPEAVLFVTQLALDFRMQFHKDVVIDLFCYRRHGHNEADEPSGTQPLMYQAINKHRTPRELYADSLVKEGVLTAEEAQKKVDEYRDDLDNGRHVVRSLVKEPNKALFVDWTPYLGHEWNSYYDTTVDLKKLQELATKMTSTPEGFVLQRQVAKIYEDRVKMTAGGLPINWGYAETLAYASLLAEGYPVRMTGQDIGRGTFSHRHAVLHNQKDDTVFVPLQHLFEGQPRMDIYDSFLSEEAVLAFEYGYASTTPNALVVWEAQFGDFANGAQVVIDQFISSGEHKWQRLSGVTMLLPHGYEGQGAEHSSARLERYLQLCSDQNIQVCVPTTPAQIFHLLRRQVVRPIRKPLVIMSPKSLLRHKLAISALDELASGSFKLIIPEIDDIDPKKVDRLVLCSGKVYYDLLEKRRTEGQDNIAIVRIEQLYPFPNESLGRIMATYPNLKRLVWCQEEPMNQGAWYCSQHNIRRAAAEYNPPLDLQYAGRESSAAPACGYPSMHAEQQQKLLEDAFTV